MKIHHICLFFALCSGKLIAQEVQSIDDSIIEKLQLNVSRHTNKALREIPNEIKEDVKNSKIPDSISDIPIKSQNWIQTQIMTMGDEEMMGAFEEVRKSLFNRGDLITRADYTWILQKALLAAIHGRPYDLEGHINDIAIFWRENTEPNIDKSPDGLGKIAWLWALDVKSRPQGVLHVGIDVHKRTFICYENTVGLYFPEGDVLERIYKEIVKSPDAASVLFGKGKNNPSRPFNDINDK